MNFMKHLNTRKGQGVASAVGGAALAAMSLIMHFEGDRPTAYIDPVGIPTICYGHTGPEVKLGTTYSREMCGALLQEDFATSVAEVRRVVRVPLTPSEEAAWGSFVYNLGLPQFLDSTALKKLNRGDHKGACAEMSRWVYGTLEDGRKVKLGGLIKRRAAERELCESELGN